MYKRQPLGFSERSPCFRFQGGPPKARLSSPTAFLKFPDSGRKAKPESVGWISHALFRSPANFGEDGRLSIKRQQQQVRWHLFFVPPFLRGGGDLSSLPRGLHPRRTRSPPGLSIHLYYTTFIIHCSDSSKCRKVQGMLYNHMKIHTQFTTRRCTR